MPHKQSGLTTIEFILAIAAGFIIYYGIEQFYVDRTMKPKEQAAIEADIKAIRKEYNDGDNNSLIRERAVKKFAEWSKALPQRYPVVRRFVCEIKDVRSSTFLRCGEGSITYLIRLAKSEEAMLGKKVKGDRLFFCGRLQSERSVTTWGGVLTPDIPVTAAVISDQKEQACALEFSPPAAKEAP